MGCCESCCAGKKVDNEKYSLRSAQKLKKTVTGMRVNPNIYNEFPTEEYLEKLEFVNRVQDRLFIEIFKSPFTEFSEITENLYLTGVGGITDKNIKDKNIKFLINATYELPKFAVNDIQFIRIPVEDSYSDDLFPYFNELSNTIEENNKKDIKTVIYCLGGMSRSPTLVIAYLMKCKQMTLKEAFTKVKSRRNRILPNRHFLRSLVKYEEVLYKKSFTNLIHVRDKTEVPDFTLKYYMNTTETGTDPDQIEHDICESIDMKISHKYQDLPINS